MTVHATPASAAHVAPAVPLAGNTNHSYEKHTGTVFPAADLSFISLAFADLTNCTFAPGTNLSNADFTGANLTNASLSGCNIDGALFRGANLTNAALPCAGTADFRGAVLTGAITPAGPCAQCSFPGPNAKDQCTVGNPVPLCLNTAAFRGVVSGVVFHDANSNGVLDFGEAGIPGVSINVSTSGGPGADVTDSRGAFRFVAGTPGPASATLATATLPAGTVLSGTAIQSFDLNACRSGQGHNFAVLTLSTPAQRSTFGRVKSLYR